MEQSDVRDREEHAHFGDVSVCIDEGAGGTGAGAGVCGACCWGTGTGFAEAAGGDSRCVWGETGLAGFGEEEIPGIEKMGVDVFGVQPVESEVLSS